ncbi:MAG: bifunctional UDP-3-O-[3-hydroxymyristoyl] N-acetylglucosamine deacetylase/3-hydroxyacyl-ACP dehydratase [Chitinophagaceae bacterium]|nr:MAG: bifunctional UDP-3-O-[3-hydroxymyristoyl] N-acetylglucosamine deacetylase/3-hydroxyacyl-ACP dehydratase [Chitinophagaceae bacterium]
MPTNQLTIKHEISLEGIGLHTGKTVKITFLPAPVDFGVKFSRTDVENSPVIEADVDNVVDVSRGTTIGKNGTTISTIEHLMAAITGAGIDNLKVEVNGPEIPILDGSSKIFSETLISVGLKSQEKEKLIIEIDSPIEFYDPEKDARLIALPSDRYKLTVMIDYQSNTLGNQYAHLNNIEHFQEEFASSRTFCFLHEIEALFKNNLIRGGSLDNAIVIVDKKVSEEELDRISGLFNQKKIEIKEEGILSNVDLIHPNEPARHKLLDVVGDLSLVGYNFKAEIIASKPGHKANIDFAKKIKNHIKEKLKNKKVTIPKYDPNKKPIYDISYIEKSLPHKYPFLLVDKIIDISEKHVVGIKNVTFNEEFFQGHFPNNPVMPGVLQLEALAQTGGILVLNTVENPQDYDTYFLMIDKAKFKTKVVPGDTLILKLELLSPIRRGICEMKGTAFVGNKIASEANLVAQIVRKEKL